MRHERDCSRKADTGRAPNAKNEVFERYSDAIITIVRWERLEVYGVTSSASTNGAMENTPSILRRVTSAAFALVLNARVRRVNTKPKSDSPAFLLVH